MAGLCSSSALVSAGASPSAAWPASWFTHATMTAIRWARRYYQPYEIKCSIFCSNSTRTKLCNREEFAWRLSISQALPYLHVQINVVQIQKQQNNVHTSWVRLRNKWLTDTVTWAVEILQVRPLLQCAICVATLTVLWREIFGPFLPMFTSIVFKNNVSYSHNKINKICSISRPLLVAQQSCRHVKNFCCTFK